MVESGVTDNHCSSVCRPQLSELGDEMHSDKLFRLVCLDERTLPLSTLSYVLFRECPISCLLIVQTQEQDSEKCLYTQLHMTFRTNGSLLLSSQVELRLVLFLFSFPIKLLFLKSSTSFFFFKILFLVSPFLPQNHSYHRAHRPSMIAFL